MFYFLSQYFTNSTHFNIFRYITFRAGMAAVTAFCCAWSLVRYLLI